MTEYRFVSRSSFGETLENQSLPVVGSANRHARRAQAWRRIIFALGGFWLVVGTVLALALR